MYKKKWKNELNEKENSYVIFLLKYQKQYNIFFAVMKTALNEFNSYLDQLKKLVERYCCVEEFKSKFCEKIEKLKVIKLK